MSRSPAPLPLAPPPSPPSRRTQLALPAYRHVPGLTPHPMRHPEGHSHGVAAHSPGREVDGLSEAWMDCVPYLYGVDLFNRAYFWEAHEAWEEVWNAVGHATLPGRLLQGMIQVSAALLKNHLDVPRGARSNFRKARVHFEAVELACGPILLGLDIPEWCGRVTAYLAEGSAGFPYIQLED